MTDRCIIVAGGEESDLPINERGNFIVACDSGYEYCKKNKVVPDLLIGDFDSYTGKLPEDVETITLPHEKDETDTFYAVKEVIKRGFKQIIITCALGNRLDHTFANIQCGLYAAEQGVQLAIIDGSAHIYFVRNSGLVLERNDDLSISVFAGTDVCYGVNIEGTQYELKDATLTNNFPLGQSNEWKNERVYLSVKEGTLVVIMARI